MRSPWGNRWAQLFGTGATLIALMAPAVRAADAPARSTWLGVYTQELTSDLRDGLDYSGKGVLVNRVVPESPADRAGLHKGDVIVSFNSRMLATPAELSDLVREMKPGQTASLGVVRDGARRTLSAKLAARSMDEDGEMPQMNDDERGSDDDSDRGPNAESEERSEGDSEHGDARTHVFKFKSGSDGTGMDVLRLMGRGRLGVRIESLNPDLGGYFGVPDGRGVLVLEVLKGTPAERAGIKAGDVITRVGDQNVEDAGDLTRAVSKQEGRVTLTVMRKSERRTIEAELERAPRVMRWDGSEGPLGMNGNDRMVIRRSGGAGDDAEMREQMRQLREELRSLREEIRKQHN